MTTTYSNNNSYSNSNSSPDNSIEIYPIEQPFKKPLIITALLVFLPALAFYWFLGDSNSLPRSLKPFFGNWISPIILWFFAASFLHLLQKRSKLKKERQQSETLAQRIFPALINEQLITPEDSDFIQSLRKAAAEHNIKPENLLLSRLTLFIKHPDNTIDETFGLKEREQLKGSYSLSRFMVWAIPILGFIGTVWGISNGIAHFSDAMTSTNSVTDVSAMLKENLPLVTNSLATAFDTTLLALLLSIPLMMLMISLEKEEEAYLIDLDERWFHDIKPLLSNGSTLNAVQLANSGGTEVTATSGLTTAESGSQNTTAVASEMKQLSTQIKALQETMEDLYETVFASKLGSDKK